MYIVHLGISGFPTGNAAAQRMRFTFKAIERSGYTPLIINKQSNHANVPYTQKVNRFDGLIFLFTSPSINRPDSFFKRNINKILGFWGELKLLYKRRKKIDSAILYTSYFAELVYYRLISKLFGFKLVIQYVEFRSSISFRNSFSEKINDNLFDNYFYKFCDGVIVISEFLKSRVLNKDSKMPIVKLPVICDFKEFEIIGNAALDFNYFLYCGTLMYTPVIYFVMDFFEKTKNQGLYDGKLMCVIGGGNPETFRDIEKKISESKFGRDIILHKNLLYSDIIPLYKSSDLLLIPLRNNIQDIARFPHKVSEYTASGRPLISSNIGELKYYFTNQESALLATDYDVDVYVDVLKQARENNISFNTIGSKGYDVGYKNFHYESHIEALRSFFKAL